MFGELAVFYLCDRLNGTVTLRNIEPHSPGKSWEHITCC
jgi:hypothetical protein